MNQQQRDSIINNCNQIDNLDISNILINFNVNLVGQYDIEVFNSLTRRMTRQLLEEFQNGIGVFLPIQYNFQNEFGSGDLELDLINLFSHIQNVNYYNSSEVILNRLIYYQIDNGFWDRGQRKIYSTNEVKAHDIQSRVLSLEKNVRSELDRIKVEKKNLTDFVAQKSAELSQIGQNLNASNSNSQQISTLLNQSTATNEKINSIFLQQQDKSDESKQFLEEKKKEFSQLTAELGESQNIINENLTEISKKQVFFDNHLEFVESKKDYFEKRNQYLNDLIGREVGASLFETFKQRKDELKNSVTLWTWLVPATVIATIIYIGLLFYIFPVTNIDKWSIITINTLKSIPAIFLLYFVTSQFRKERNFQEEYAFKSAVALTIMAYAEQIKSDDSKDALIINAVKGIYETPFEKKIVKEKEESSNTIIEGIKALKETAMEAIKTK